ncbi:MAG: hypothetical protein RBQ87_01265 [Candidatus Cloacimonadaceae bacterium]|jgi:hypothetical protein|nr:hypothetical protein [Candidatus Cloacimonadaceae bacterium]
MSLGADIKEVIAEVGDPITILRTPANITGEYVKMTVNAQVTKPFIREFFMEGWMSYDTRAVSGDWIQLADGRVFMIMNRTPKMFEGSVMRYNSVLYKTNAVVTIQRQLLSAVDYTSQVAWSTVKAGAHVLITEALYGNALDADEAVGQINMSENDLYIPASVGLQERDRVWVSADEYYMVETIRKRRFDNVDLATIGEDTR